MHADKRTFTYSHVVSSDTSERYND